MALKINMAKAYDRVEWSFLEAILALHGFSLHFVSLIWKYVSNSSYPIFVNSSLYEHFNVSRGIRQGDPFSLSLFTLVFYVLSRILLRATMSGRLYGTKVNRTSMTILHLMYANDLTIYCKESTDEAKESLIVWSCLVSGAGKC